MQSRTTHQGLEAAECARLLTFLISKTIAGELSNKEDIFQLIASTELDEDIDLDALLRDEPVPALANTDVFRTKCSSIHHLALSLAEPSFDDANVPDPNRDWNWKKPDFRYSRRRVRESPGYIGR